MSLTPTTAILHVLPWVALALLVLVIMLGILVGLNQRKRRKALLASINDAEEAMMSTPPVPLKELVERSLESPNGEAVAVLHNEQGTWIYDENLQPLSTDSSKETVSSLKPFPALPDGKDVYDPVTDFNANTKTTHSKETVLEGVADALPMEDLQILRDAGEGLIIEMRGHGVEPDHELIQRLIMAIDTADMILAEAEVKDEEESD